MKTCLDCREDRSLDLFNRDSSRPDGLAAYCRPCFKVRRDKWYHANRESVRLQQDSAGSPIKRRIIDPRCMPGWFEHEKVRRVYEKSRQLGMTVDHIVPLKGKTVCGLHCWHNLQLLSHSENMRKGIRHWPDAP